MAPNSNQTSAPLEASEAAPVNERKETAQAPMIETRSFRTTAPQVIATMAQSMLLLALGMLVSFSTIVIGELQKSDDPHLHMSDTQASWFAGILLISQPLGSVLSGFIQDRIGRKKCMLLVNVPQLIGWTIVYNATSVTMLFGASVMMGFSIGFMEAPTLSYVGEIAQPHLRGTLASFTSVYISSGTLLMYLLGSVTDWRTAGALSGTVPILAFIAILMVPESPLWLLIKGRREEAMKSLCWLRGWVEPKQVEREFQIMSQHSEASQLRPTPLNKMGSYIQVSTNTDPEMQLPSKGPTVKEKLKDIVRPEMLRPLRLVVFFFFFLHCAALNGSKPYLVKVFESLGVEMRPQVLAVMAASFQLLGSFFCMGLVRKTGKKKLAMTSMCLCATVLTLLGTYSVAYVKFTVNIPWIPTCLVPALFFFMNTGIGVIPWTLLAEVFPSRGRGVGGGVSAATYYFWYFLVTKTFLDLTNLITLTGVFFFYSFIGFCGVLFLFKFQPETEGKRLEEVEAYFKSKRKCTES